MTTEYADRLDTIAGEVMALAEEMRQAEREFPLYCQRDPLWANDRMNNTSSTLGSWGCLVTIVASMLVRITGDTSITPGTLNKWLGENGGYVNGASFVFGSLEKMWPVKFVADWIYPYPKRADTAAINARIEQGQYALIKVDFKPTTVAVDEHWVLVTRVNEDQTYQIMDGWYGKLFQMPPAYAKEGWEPGDTIFRVAFYEKV